jgi:hypothetical protein
LRASSSSSAPKFFLRDTASSRLRKHALGRGVVSLGANWTIQCSTMQQQMIVNKNNLSDQIRTPANDAN